MAPDTPPRRPLKARERRALREAARREKAMRRRKLTTKDKLVAGCFSIGIMLIVAFVIFCMRGCWVHYHAPE